MYWLSRRTPNDLFLLYSFADTGLPTAELRAFVADRGAGIPDLRVRLREVRGDLDYPSWVLGGFGADQFVEHRLPRADWAHLLDAVGELLGTGVDATASPWRLHVFRGVEGAPMRATEAELAIVVVLQMSHALADGRRSSEIARALFGAGEDTIGHGSAFGSGSTAASDPVAGPGSAVDALGAGAAGSGVMAEAGRRGSDVLNRIRAAAADRIGTAAVRSVRRFACRVEAATGAVVNSRDRFGDYPMVAPDRPLRSGATAEQMRPDGLQRVPPRARPGPLFGIIGKLDFAPVLGVLRMPVRVTQTAVRGVHAYRAQRELAELTATGRLPAAGPGFTPGAVNRCGAGDISRHQVRMIVRDADSVRVPGRTVTVMVLTAISVALAEYLAARGEPVDRLGAQVPMALPAASGRTRNNYRSLGVDLHLAEPDLRRRADRIAADLSDRRIRAAHPLLAAQDRVTAVTPAPLLRRDIARYPLDTVPDTIAGHTVVSSVHRGPADLTFAGAPVRFTAGFPAIGSVMHLTHGVHGLGDTVTISVHADPVAVPDLDAYVDRLRAALDLVSRT